jgi:hypothetical protein
MSSVFLHFLFIDVRTAKLVQIYINFCVLTTIKEEWKEYTTSSGKTQYYAAQNCS